MSIKNLKPKKNSNTKQGYFSVTTSTKYFGNGPVIYRSSWEYKFCVWAERNPNVKKWSSESVSIKYWNSFDDKYSLYYPDFLIELVNGLIFLIEVKPASHMTKPNLPKRQTKKSIANYLYVKEQYTKNMCKFQAAIKYCEAKSWKFRIADESWFKNI